MHGRPTVDLRDVGFREDEYCDYFQSGTDKDALDDIQQDGPFWTKIPHENEFHAHIHLYG